jgi:RND family efflux transporter MFP subunit
MTCGRGVRRHGRIVSTFLLFFFFPRGFPVHRDFSMQLTPSLPVLAAVAAGVLLGGCGQAPSASSQAQPPEVTVAPPVVEQIIEWDDYVGKFEPIEHVDVRPRVSGYVVGVHFEDGERVEKGQLLFTIDPRPVQAALAQAEADLEAASARLENARAELERIRGLAEKHLASKEDLDTRAAAARTAEAGVDAAKAAVQAQKLNLGFTRITAPIDGRVSYRRVDPGNAVKADETVLTTLVSVDPIYFEFQGSEALYLKYKRIDRESPESARTVRIRLQDENVPHWTGRLVFMDNVIDAGSGTIRGRALVDNPDGFLTPGMFGHMQLQASTAHDALLVPDTAVATRGADRILYVVDEGGVVAARTVELGPLHEGLRVIRSGITAGDRIVVDGQQRARPGQRVTANAARIDAPKARGAAAAGGGAAGAAASRAVSNMGAAGTASNTAAGGAASAPASADASASTR